MKVVSVSILPCSCETCWVVATPASLPDSTPLRASDTFSTTKHVSLGNIVSLLNVRNIGISDGFCAVFSPLDAKPRVGKPHFKIYVGGAAEPNQCLFCCAFGAIFIHRLFKYPGTLVRYSAQLCRGYI